MAPVGVFAPARERRSARLRLRSCGAFRRGAFGRSFGRRPFAAAMSRARGAFFAATFVARDGRRAAAALTARARAGAFFAARLGGRFARDARRRAAGAFFAARLSNGFARGARRRGAAAFTIVAPCAAGEPGRGRGPATVSLSGRGRE
ncbi:MAG TPA: hypothetical protein VGW98_12885 [Solirubrobacteraceae bacterium]|nr:hypothetical protein [Solirubrobacteraceae bacterium]